MRAFDALLLALFLAFEAGALLLIAAAIQNQRSGPSPDRERLLLFLGLCLMPVCMGVLRHFGQLSLLVGGCLGVVAATCAAGLALSRVRWPTRGGAGEERAVPAPPEAGRKVYQIYYQGEVLGLITREGINRLMAAQLLKRQPTVELVDEYRARAREQGVEIRLLKNPASGQVLVKVEAKNP
ncbi:MAG: hypothetical protein FJY95_02325 [Candidatus Handelsmanbacteria bacterium]|nr:hypothetical protein [Candidatus Handelsmanbacteria bacterium]